MLYAGIYKLHIFRGNQKFYYTISKTCDLYTQTHNILASISEKIIHI
jgi:hypothetical protein